LFDYPSDWAWKAQPQGASFDYFALTFAFYKALRGLGLNVDIINARQATLSDYKMVLAPGILALPQPVLEQLATYQGIALLGPRTNVITPELSIPVPMGPNLPNLDTTVTMTETLPAGSDRPLMGGGVLHGFVEHLEGSADTVAATFEGPALVANGGVHYLAGWPIPETLTDMLQTLCAQAKITTSALPEGLRCRTTSTHRFWFNYAPDTITHNGVAIPAAGVHWEVL